MRLKSLLLLLVVPLFLTPFSSQADDFVEPLPWEIGFHTSVYGADLTLRPTADSQYAIYFDDGRQVRSMGEMLEAYPPDVYGADYTNAYKAFVRANRKNTKELLKFYWHVASGAVDATFKDIESVDVVGDVTVFTKEVLMGRTYDGEPLLFEPTGEPFLPHDVRLALQAGVLLQIRRQEVLSYDAGVFLQALFLHVDAEFLDPKTFGLGTADKLKEWYRINELEGGSWRDMQLQYLSREAFLARPLNLVLMAYVEGAIKRREAKQYISYYLAGSYQELPSMDIDQRVTQLLNDAIKGCEQLTTEDVTTALETLTNRWEGVTYKSLQRIGRASTMKARKTFSTAIYGAKKGEIKFIVNEVIRTNAKEVARRPK